MDPNNICVITHTRSFTSPKDMKDFSILFSGTKTDIKLLSPNIY